MSHVMGADDVLSRHWHCGTLYLGLARRPLETFDYDFEWLNRLHVFVTHNFSQSAVAQSEWRLLAAVARAHQSKPAEGSEQVKSQDNHKLNSSISTAISSIKPK